MILYYIIFGKVDISAILVAIFGFAVNFGVYVSEMMRTGIDAVDKGQIEAAHAIGFTKAKTFWKITFPQAARHFLPVFKGEFISMVKMTSVVGYIAIQDLTKVSDIICSRTLEAFFPLIATAVIYFLVANVLTMLLTRLEIMLGPVDLLRLSRQEAYDEGMRLLNTVGLAEKALSYPDELSGGQKQRVAIARALAMKPEIILFDEPTSALDPTMVSEVLAVIRSLAREGLTMMIVTHEMKFARDVSTRIFYMDEGGIYEDGPPGQIFDNPQRERTRSFVKRLKTFEREITSSTFDFIEVSTGIEEFGRRQLLSQRQVNNLALVFEELCVQTLLSQGGEVLPLRFSASVSELDGSCEAAIFYSGPAMDLFTEHANELSVRMVLGLTKEHAWSGENGNHIALVL